MNEKEIIERLVKTMSEASSILNDIKFELSSRVYTLTEDEFENVFYARDLLDHTLLEIGRNSRGEPVN